MKSPTIPIEGAILSGDIIDRIETGDMRGQKPAGFALDGPVKSRHCGQAAASACKTYGCPLKMTRKRPFSCMKSGL